MILCDSVPSRACSLLVLPYPLGIQFGATPGFRDSGEPWQHHAPRPLLSRARWHADARSSVNDASSRVGHCRNTSCQASCRRGTSASTAHASSHRLARAKYAVTGDVRGASTSRTALSQLPTSSTARSRNCRKLREHRPPLHGKPTTGQSRGVLTSLLRAGVRHVWPRHFRKPRERPLAEAASPRRAQSPGITSARNATRIANAATSCYASGA